MAQLDISARKVAADGRRKQIVASAAQIFEHQGYASATMESIARQVGLAKPTLYHYFASKDDIFFAIHEEFIDLLIDGLAERAARGLSVTKQLREVIEDVFGLMQSHRGHVRVFFEHYRELPSEHQDIIRTKRDSYEASVRAIIDQGIADGSLREVNSRLVSLAMFGMSNWAYQWYRPDGPMDIHALADVFWEFLAGGIVVS